MKRTFLLSIIALIALIASAQKGLEVSKLFGDRFRDDERVSETYISGDSRMEKYGVDLYHSLTIVGAPELISEVESIVSHDGTQAIDREVSYRDGGLYYGFYVLKPKKRDNRYLFFLNQHRAGGDRMILIYLEGPATKERIRSMLK